MTRIFSMTVLQKAALLLLLGAACNTFAQDAQSPSPVPAVASNPFAASTAVTATSPQYVLRAGDVVQVKVYQEDDLTSVSRIGQDGCITMPLLGSITVVSNTLAEATRIIHNLLARDYLVNPQVSLNVVEFAKRRFTVLGQVARPGTFDMPTQESVSLLQAIATAGGYTRIGNPRKISVQRMVGAENKVFKIDAEAMASNKDEQPFMIQPDDVIIVGEKWI